MPRTQTCRRITALSVGLFVFSSLFTQILRASPGDQEKVKALLSQAEAQEQIFEWEKACDFYETALRLERNLPEVRARYMHALRRSWQQRRNKDVSYRKEVLSLEYGQSVRLCNTILDNLLDNSLDGKNVALSTVLQKGIDELNLGLADPNFCQLYLPSFKMGETRDFRDWLSRLSAGAAPANRGHVKKQMREIALAAMTKLQMSATAAIMEMAAGSCYAFDDYTVYFTPNQLREFCDSLKGEYVGVGITLGVADGKLAIAAVAPFSPAAEAMPALGKDDQLLAINKKSVANLTPETALEMLEGPAGTTVDIELQSPVMGNRVVTLRRRALFVPSVTSHMKNEVVGYLNIACFQETTLQEVDDALFNLKKNNMKALVLDLRGNTGGLFEVAVEVVRRFLDQGVIVSTQSSRTSTIYHARNQAALGVPLVVLVDGDTASSAEVVAGAIKDNKRGRLVGQATFGKGCTQSIFKMPSGPGGVPTGGLRITVARFFSPEGVSYAGRGVVPHMLVDRMLMPMNMQPADHQLDEAILEAHRLLMGS